MNDDEADRFPANYTVAAPDILRPLRTHAAFIIVFVVSAMLSALALTYVYAERYRAELTIFFKPSNVTRLSNHTPQALGSPFPSANLPFKVITQTIAGLADTDTMLRRIVADLNLDAKVVPDVSGPWYIHAYKTAKNQLAEYAADGWQLLKWGRLIQEDPVDKAIAELRREVKVRSDDSYLFSVQVTAKTPAGAAAIADDIGKVLTELVHHDDEIGAQAQTEGIAGLRDDKLQQIEAVSASMQRLLASNHVASIQEEIDKTTDRALQLAKDKTDTLANLRQGEGSLANLMEKLRPYDPAVATRALDLPGLRRSPGLTADDYSKLYADKLAADVANMGLRTRLDAIDQSMAAAQLRLQVLNQAYASYDLLSVQLQSLKRDFVTLTDAYQEAQIGTASGRSELRVQANAEAVGVPVSPIKIYHVIAAGILAAMIAVGMAFVLDYFDIRVFMLGGHNRPQRSRTAALQAEAD